MDKAALKGFKDLVEKTAVSYILTEEGCRKQRIEFRSYTLLNLKFEPFL